MDGRDEFALSRAGEGRMLPTHAAAQAPFTRERQAGAEFTRLVSADILKSFLRGHDQDLPRLINLYEEVHKTNLGHDIKLQSS